MKFKLQATHDDGTVVTHEFEEDVWYAALDNFVKFLRGCGYHLEYNSVGINEGLNHWNIDGHNLGNITTFTEE